MKQTSANRSETLRMIAAGVLLCFAAYLSSPGRGILSCLPYAVAAGIASGFLYRGYAFDQIVFSLALFAFTVVEAEGAGRIAVYVVGLSLFFALSFFFTSSMRKTFPRRLRPGIAVCFLAVCAALSLVAYGNPVSATLAQTNAVKFYRGNYENERFTLERTRFDPIAREYVCEFTLKNGERMESAASTVFSAQPDAYWELVCTRAAALRKSELLKILHENFSDGAYQIAVTPQTDAAVYPNAEALGDDPERLHNRYDYQIEFTVSFSAAGTREAKSAFAGTVRSYVRALRENGFSYHKLTFRGGEREKMLYELSCTPDTSPEELTADRIVILGI